MPNDLPISLDSWRRQGQYFYFNGYPIFYQDTGGSKPTLLLVHGFPTASWDWAKIWPVLSKKYRLVALDLFGYGFSAKPKRYKYSVSLQADLIESLLCHLSIENVGIIAHDYGDTVTQELLARKIEQGKRYAIDIGSVSLLNGGLFPEVHRPRFIQTLLKSPIGSLISRLQTKHKFAKTISAIFAKNSPPTDQEIDGFWELMTFNNGRAIFHLLIKYLDERKAFRYRWVGALQNSAVPIQFINGLDDPISGEHMMLRFQELVPKGKVVALSNAGHYPQVEAPEQVLDAIEDFLQALER